ncbi:MAG: DUF222 domain-containing protein [Acidimicrobiales bacterium]|nr:DUF222 domain-containing protein [Acidimicrobiales bacterium]
MFTATITAMREDRLDGLPRAELVDRVEQLRRFRGAVADYEARLVRAIDGLDDNGLDGRGVLRSHGRVSGRAAHRAARTAHGLADMPRAEAALAAGRITVEHAHSLTKAGREINPESADAELVEIAETSPADLFAKRTTEWITKRKKSDPKPDHDAQRRARTLKRWDDKATGLRMFLLGVDQTTGALLDADINRLEQTLWNDDGGRNADPNTARTLDQRLADATVQLITGARRTADRPPHPKSNVTIMIDLADMTTDDGAPLATLVQDGQPLPASVLDRLLCVSTITPMLFNGPSNPIWVGRDYRHATLTQWRALIARDRGCIGCGANPDRCQAHHIRYWEHFGPTDIDNLVLVCSRCHHNIHDRGHTLHRTNGRWTIRPPGAPPGAKQPHFPTPDFPTTPEPAHITPHAA